jgi:hypothetical protein
VSIKRIFRQAWELYRKSFLRFVLTAAVIFVVLEFFAALAESSAHAHRWAAAVLAGIVSFLLWIVGTFWVQGALIEAAGDARRGRTDLSVGELYRRAQPLLPSLILIVPGLILLTRWIFIVPVIVLEKKSAGESFGRSWQLVKGSSWPVFWLIFLTMIVLGAGSALISTALFSFSFLPYFFSRWIVNTITSSLTAPFAALVWTLGYFELVREQVQPRATKLPPIRL